MSSVGQRIREIRARRGLTLLQLADMSGVGRDSISNIETGRHNPHPSTLGKLAAALEVDVSEFFKDKPEPPKAYQFCPHCGERLP